ncbi:hypothetical protein D3C85_1629180 [compost metagenome]
MTGKQQAEGDPQNGSAGHPSHDDGDRPAALLRRRERSTRRDTRRQVNPGPQPGHRPTHQQHSEVIYNSAGRIGQDEDCQGAQQPEPLSMWREEGHDDRRTDAIGQ